METKHSKTMLLFAEMGDDGVREVDPATDLYPFVVLASGDISDLSAVFFYVTKRSIFGIQWGPKFII